MTAKITPERFEEIKAVVAEASAIMTKITAESHTSLPYECKLGCILSPNKLWVKVFKYDVWPGKTDEEAMEHGRSAWAFIDAEGKVWKAASWASAAKNAARGNLSHLQDPVVMKGWQYSVR